MEKEKGERENDAKVMELTQRRDCCNFSVSQYSTRHVDGSYAFPFQQIRNGESMDRPPMGNENEICLLCFGGSRHGGCLPASLSPSLLFLLLTPLAIITLLFPCGEAISVKRRRSTSRFFPPPSPSPIIKFWQYSSNGRCIVTLGD